MTPTSYCYFDYYQSDHPEEPLAIGGFLPLQKVYNYEPIPEELSEKEASFIKGTQANLWTEYIPNLEKLEYMAFPRASALAEVAWTSPERKDFDDFIMRISQHLKRLKVKGVNAANHLYELKSNIQPKAGKVMIKLETLAKDAAIFYTTDGSEPSPNSAKYDTSIETTSDINIYAQVFADGEKVGRKWNKSIEMHSAAGKEILLTHDPHPKYSGSGNGSLINGVKGSNVRYGDAEWLGFSDGTDFEAIIDLGDKELIESAQFRFFKGEGQWIYLPKSVTIYTSQDGENFSKIISQSDIETSTKIAEVNIPFSKTESRYFKISIENYGTIPAGKQGGGHSAWLFVDEITLN